MHLEIPPHNFLGCDQCIECTDPYYILPRQTFRSEKSLDELLTGANKRIIERTIDAPTPGHSFARAPAIRSKRPNRRPLELERDKMS